MGMLWEKGWDIKRDNDSLVVFCKKISLLRDFSFSLANFVVYYL